jgi:hypothetical protein
LRKKTLLIDKLKRTKFFKVLYRSYKNRQKDVKENARQPPLKSLYGSRWLWVGRQHPQCVVTRRSFIEVLHLGRRWFSQVEYHQAFVPWIEHIKAIALQPTLVR